MRNEENGWKSSVIVNSPSNSLFYYLVNSTNGQVQLS